MRARLAFVCLALAGCAADAPYFQSVLAPESTADTLGPYRVEARVVADRGVFRLLAVLAADAEGTTTVDVPLELVEGDERYGLWVVDLPGRPAGSVYRFQLELIDTDGAIVRHPAGDAPAWVEFEVLQAASGP